MATEDKKDETEASEAAPSVSEGVDETAEKAAEKVAVKDAEAAPEPKAEAKPAEPAEEEENLIAEPDRINVGVIAAITLAIVVVTVGVVVGVHQFFTQTMQGEVGKKVNEYDDPAKKELAAVEAARLGKYQWQSQKDGIVRIPVTRARELVLADYGKMAAYQPGVSPTPPPSASVAPPAPAPEGSSSVEPATSASVAPSVSVSAAPSGSVPPSPSLSPSASASVIHKH